MDTTTNNAAPRVSEGLRFLLGQSHRDLFALVDELTVDGGVARLGIKETAEQVRHERQLSGFRYIAEGWIQGHLLLAFLPDGGFVVQSAIAEDSLVSERTDFYNEAGIFTHSQVGPASAVMMLEGLDMDLDCPLRDQLYNFLASEYNRTKSGHTRTSQIYSVEKFFRTRGSKRSLVSSIKRRRDPLIRHEFKKMLEIESDPVLNWDERQVVYDNILNKLARVLKVKQRACGIGPVTQTLIMLRFRWSSFLKRLRMRPVNNVLGIAYAMTIQKMLWFFQTVRANLGLSVAMAVYGPFTYFFITMPMNPHAMKAVGILDEAKINVISRFASAPEAESRLVEQPLQTRQAAPLTTQTIVAPTNPNLMLNSVVATGSTAVPLVLEGKGTQVLPTHMNLLLTTDVKAIDQVSWTERMSNFKQVQIAYEEGLESAQRMGRLEQLETQYNFPMVVESAWEEMERYNAQIFRLRKRHPDMSPKLKQYLTNEVNRTQQLELYLWDRLGRFILDQPYVMLDQDKEQKRSDYYVGRAFVFMEEMTKVMGWRYPDFKRPYGYEKIEALAKNYTAGRKESGDILTNLQANSDLFRQKDVYSTKEFRNTMKRQWTILYLQNLKAEEASNNGLNMYIWSVRNTVWCLQSIYSAKRQELDLLLQKDIEGQLDSAGKVEVAKIDGLYETLFHNLTLEWVGIKEEIGTKLGKDIETTQRQVVIENLKEFIGDRAKLFTQTATTAEISDKIAE